MLLYEKASLNFSGVQPWTAASKKFAYLPTKAGVGPGEEKLAAELGGKIMGGSVSYDIVLSNGKKLEVKELDKDGSLRTGTEGINAIAPAMSTIYKICDELTDLDLVVLRSAAGSEYPEALDAFITDEIPLIKKGEMTSARGIGGNGKFGLLQAIEFVNMLLRSNADEDHTVSLDDKDIDVDGVQFAKVADVVGLDDDMINVSTLTKELAKAKSKAFKDPDWFVDAVWARAAIPSASFPDADILAIVSDSGFKLIPKSKLDSALTFTRVSQCRPRFRVNK